MIMHAYSYGTPIRVWDIILAHTRMGYPIRVWDVPYAYGTIYAYGAEQIYYEEVSFVAICVFHDVSIMANKLDKSPHTELP